MRPKHWIIEKGTVLLKEKPCIKDMVLFRFSSCTVSLNFKYFWTHLNFDFSKTLCLWASVLLYLFGLGNSCTYSNFLCLHHYFLCVKIFQGFATHSHKHQQLLHYLYFTLNSLPKQLQGRNWSGTFNCYNSMINSGEIMNLYLQWLYSSLLYLLKGLSNVDNADLSGLRLI